MALSVRLDPAIEAQLEQQTHKLAMTKTEFVKDAIERANVHVSACSLNLR
jgi:predicted DNA-binding protein